jgi:outer membrane receptor protein involved in Fe transport
VPNQLTQYVHDQQNDLWMRNDGFYVQQQWTRGRLTLQGALRFDRAWSWAPEQRLESRFWAQPLVFDETPVVDSYTDLTPRAAVTYDLFGNGKTALQGDARQVPRVHGHRLQLRARQPDVAHCHQRHAYVDRSQRQLEP